MIKAIAFDIDNTIYDYNTFIENFRKIKHIRDE